MLWLAGNTAMAQAPSGGNAAADNAGIVPPRAEMAAQQESIRRQFRELTVRMLEASARLEQSDPAAAKAIRQAVEQAQQAMIEQNMGQVSQLLSRGLTALAGSAQGQVVESLRKVLATLEQESAGQTDPETVKQWQQYLQRVQELQRQQEKLASKASSQPGSQPSNPPASQATSQAASSPAQQAQKQQELAQAAEKLGQEMSRPAGSTSRPAPGAAPTAQAASEMKQAAAQLAQKDSSQAQTAQEQAKRDLAQAQKELKEALDQAKQEQQEKALAQLSAALAKALARQQELSRQTRAMDTQRPKDSTPRELQLKLAELAAGQRALAGDVASVRPLVEADAALAVFPRVLRETEQAAVASGVALAKGESGPLVQASQKQVESYLATLLAALKDEMKARQEKQAAGGEGGGSGGGGGGSSEEQRLVKHTQELKVLLSLQRELRDQTAELDNLARQGKLDEASRQAQAAALAQRQRQLREMTQEMQRRESGQLLKDGTDAK